jgi:DNA segregation ATPase FtsK/SpoIIIE, S-DNA-T family
MTETTHRSMTDSVLQPSDTDPEADRFAVHRPARVHPRPVPAGEVVVAPPPLRRGGAAGWFPALFPLLGSAGSLLLLSSAVQRRRWLILLVVASLLLSLCAGLAPWLRHRRSAHRERARYLDHLDEVARSLERVAAAQHTAAEYLYPDLPGILALAAPGGRLWERRPTNEDFLAVRLGRGAVPLAAPVRLDRGHDPLAERDPFLLAAAEDLVRRGSRLGASPVVVPLRRAGVLALTGPRAPARALVRFVLAQVATFHAPEDLHILLACPPADAPVWEWLKWLPHVRDRAAEPGPAVPGSLLATTAEQLRAHLKRELHSRLAASPGPHALASPVSGTAGPPNGVAHLLVIIDGFSPRGHLGRLPPLSGLLERAAELGATVLCLVDRHADEPAELRVRIRLDGAGGMVLEETGPGGAVGRARADAADGAPCEALARRLAPLRLARSQARGRAAPGGPVRLLELLGVGEAAAIDPAKTWRSRPRASLLRVPIGRRGARDQGTLADSLVLDLKEAAEGGMGPHGLLIGATGSGKSELLRTIVAGLAISHPPELLSFVLVDFKGGAAFAGLDALPHTAGSITNLSSDLALVDRVRAALQGEQERRQRVLRGAGNLDGIAQYHARRAVDPSLRPLPYLLLVVDEFGELLAARPEFLDVFTAIGRVGRSLGMHLLLASQRLDEGRIRGLESHLRYRVCLRTFAAADSVAVLGTTDAHRLPPSPGGGWLKVDSDPPQRFEGAVVSVATGGHGTVALATGPGRQTPTPAPAILPFEPVGPAAAGSSPPVPDAERCHGLGDTDGDAVVAALSGAALSGAALSGADRPGGRACRVWLPPLASAISLDEVLAQVPHLSGVGPRPGAEGWLRVPVVVVDRPLEQAQEPLMLDFGGAAGHLAIVGAPRSGKSTLLATVTAAFALTHAPDALQLYCIDLGGGLLHQLAGLPHVGAVCGRGDREEARHLVHQLRGLVAMRESGLVAMREGGFRNRGARPRVPGPGEHPRDPPPGDGGYGEVLLLVDNWARLRQELEDLELEIEALAATGLQHGVHLVVTANRWADLRLALRDNLGGRLELRLNDPLDSAIGRVAEQRALPDDRPGRGLTSAGLQFQVALPVVGAAVPECGGDRWLANASGELARRALRSPGGAMAPALRMLPTAVSLSDLPASGGVSPGGVPLGLHEYRLEPVWVDLLSGPPHFLVLGDAECGKTSVLRCLAGGLSARHPPDEVRLVVVDCRRTLVDLSELPHCAVYACTPAMAAGAVAHLRSVLEQRAPWRQAVSPRGWGGPRHVLVVDDYHLVAGTSGNPLEPLLDLIAQGHEVGLHVLLACAAAGAARAAFDPFLRRLHDVGSPGLMMSGDPRDGPLLGGRTAVPLPPGRGVLVRRRGVSGLIQVAWTPPPATATTLRVPPTVT